MNSISPKEAFDFLKPERTVFVISYDNKNQRPSGMVAGYNTKCASDPYMYAVALWKKGYTHKLIRDCKEFVVALPNKKLEKAIEIFGTLHGDKVDKFKRTKVKTSPSKYIQPPLLTEATINLECKLIKELDCGDHILFIGEVVAAHYNKGKLLMNMGKINGKRIFKEL